MFYKHQEPTIPQFKDMFQSLNMLEKLITLCSTNITSVWNKCKAGIKKPNPKTK